MEKKYTSLLMYFLSLNILLGQTQSDINRAKSFLKNTGMSKNDAIKMAKSKGYSDSQINAALKKEDLLNKNNQTIQDVNEQQSSGIPKLEEINPLNNEKEGSSEIFNDDQNTQGKEKSSDIIVEKKPQDLQFFGYNIFQMDPSLFQSSSAGAVDPNYLIAPGDEIIIMLWGETQFREVLSVDKEGFVFIPEIGQVFVNGLNLNLLESKLFRIFSQSYASLNPQGREPTTFFDVSLGNLRPLRIQVLGEVAKPGAYIVSPSTTLFSSLYFFNGPTELGSLRDIQLIRSGKKISSIDFYDYLLTGRKLKDFKLQLDDVVFIPPRLKTISIEGEINRPGIYELLPNEGLEDLIPIAGKLKISAYLKRAQIDRIVPFSKRSTILADRIFLDVDLRNILDKKENFLLQDGDKIKVFSVSDQRQNFVEIRGAVTRPGNYELGDSLKLSELIEKAEGVHGDAYLERVDLIRTYEDMTEELIKLNLGKVLIKEKNEDISLNGFDRVQVYSLSEMVPKDYVILEGHVKNPGNFLLFSKMTLYDLLFRYGGFIDTDFKNKTYTERSELIRNKPNGEIKEIIPFSLEDALNKKPISTTLLQPNDKVKIYSRVEVEGDTQFVEIKGFVKRPGKYELFKENMTIRDLLFTAGGFNDDIHKSRTYMDRIDLIRFEKDQISQQVLSLNLDSILSDETSTDNYALLPGDIVTVYSKNIFNSIGIVNLNGSIRKQGDFIYKNGMTIKDLILEAGGFNDQKKWFKIDIARLDTINLDLDHYALLETIYINNNLDLINVGSLNETYQNIVVKENDFLLMPYDRIIIRPDPYHSFSKKIHIIGKVVYPGEYAILSSEEKVTDVIERAGGLLPNAYPDASQYVRNSLKFNLSLEKIMKNTNSRLNFTVQDGDSIIIVSHPKIVVMDGQVNKKGIHPFVPNKRMRYYIKKAGGLSPEADIKNIWVEYPNGSSKQFKALSFLSPKVIDGSFIRVGKKKEEEPFNVTEFAKEFTSILANLAQALAIVLIANQ